MLKISKAHAKTLRRKEDAKDREKGNCPQAFVPSVPLCFKKTSSGIFGRMGSPPNLRFEDQ